MIFKTKKITSSFNRICVFCGEKIEKGISFDWYAGRNMSFHVECAEEFKKRFGKDRALMPYVNKRPAGKGGE